MTNCTLSKVLKHRIDTSSYFCTCTKMRSFNALSITNVRWVLLDRVLFLNLPFLQIALVPRNGDGSPLHQVLLQLLHPDIHLSIGVQVSDVVDNQSP